MIFIDERLKEIRESRDWRQKEMADIIGVKRSAYASWEISQNIIPLEYVNRISNTFNISLDYIWGLSNNYKKNISNSEINLSLLGKRLRISRKLAKLTQLEIADKFNTNRSTLSNYETGRTIIQTIYIIEWAKLTNTSIDWLCGKTEEKNIVL